MRKNLITLMLLITILTACNTQTAYKEEIENKKQEEIVSKSEEIKSENKNLESKKDEINNTELKDTNNKPKPKKTQDKDKKESKPRKKKKSKDKEVKKGKSKDNKSKPKKNISKNNIKAKKVNKENKTPNTYNEIQETTNNQTTTENNTTPNKGIPVEKNKEVINTQPTIKEEHKTTQNKEYKEKPITKEKKQEKEEPTLMTITTEREIIPAEHKIVYKPEWYPSEAPRYKDNRKDGYDEYKVYTYSDGTVKRELIKTVQPFHYTEYIGTRSKFKESTNEWDGIYRPNQLIYKNTERYFTILPYADYDNGVVVVNNNEVAAFGNTADVNDNESTYFSGHFDSVFKDIRDEGQIGDEIIITDEYGQTAFYQITDIFYYPVGSDVSNTPVVQYYRSSGKEQIQIQTCEDATQRTYIIYTADKV